VKEEFNDLSVKELRELKQAIADLIKEKSSKEKVDKEIEKTNKFNFAKENLKVGEIVLFTYKGEECEGEVAKLNDKTFTVTFSHSGEDKVLARAYHLFILKVSEEEKDIA